MSDRRSTLGTVERNTEDGPGPATRWPLCVVLDNGLMPERPVNARQLAVLEWIVDGCPDGVMAGSSYKTTAVALQGRRLAVVTKNRGVWKAEATEAGRYFVQHDAYPPGHWSVGSKADAPEGVTPPIPGPSRSKPRRATPQPGALRPVDQMMADLIEAGGELRVDVIEAGHWERLVGSARRYKKVPEGKLLTIAYDGGWAKRIIRLEDPPAWMTAELAPIPVAQELRRPHPVVKALRADKNRLKMTPEARGRALRVLDALAKAAESRGYVMRTPTPEADHRYAKGYLEVSIGEQVNVVDVQELNDRVPHQPTAKELRDQERFSWMRIPTHDQVPSGRLSVRLLRGWAIRQDRFDDTKTVRVEDRLAVMLQEIELRAEAAAERERQREIEQQERRRRWKRVLEEAKVQAREQHRANVLRRQATQWQEAQQLDAYLDAMADRILALDGEEKTAAEEWLDWARNYRNRFDPLSQSLGMPGDPEFTHDVLRPYMRGMSPYAPPDW